VCSQLNKGPFILSGTKSTDHELRHNIIKTFILLVYFHLKDFYKRTVRGDSTLDLLIFDTVKEDTIIKKVSIVIQIYFCISIKKALKCSTFLHQIVCIYHVSKS
jgi:hypothetical protein